MPNFKLGVAFRMHWLRRRLQAHMFAACMPVFMFDHTPAWVLRAAQRRAACGGAGPWHLPSWPSGCERCQGLSLP